MLSGASALALPLRCWLAVRPRNLTSLRPSVQPLGELALNAKELRRLVKEARTPRKPKAVSPRNSTSRALGNGISSWRCCDCHVEKTLADFYLRTRGRVGSYCKSCESERNANYRQTLRGNAGTLVRNARQRSKIKGLGFNLDIDFILDLVLRQEGRCAYSDVQMQMLLPHSDWRMSLERVDNTAGYVRDNCVLIAAEFNSTEKLSTRALMSAASGSSKWSLEKVQNFTSERHLNVDLQGLDKLIKAAQENYPSLPRLKPVFLTASVCELKEFEGVFGRFPCCTCGLWKPSSDFSLQSSRRSRLRSICKQCDGELRFRRRTTLRGHVQSMLDNARYRHKLGKWHGNFELDLDCVLKMLWRQQGRCFYSDVPLRFGEYNVD